MIVQPEEAPPIAYARLVLGSSFPLMPTQCPNAPGVSKYVPGFSMKSKVLTCLSSGYRMCLFLSMSIFVYFVDFCVCCLMTIFPNTE